MLIKFPLFLEKLKSWLFSSIYLHIFKDCVIVIYVAAHDLSSSLVWNETWHGKLLSWSLLISWENTHVVKETVLYRKANEIHILPSRMFHFLNKLFYNVSAPHVSRGWRGITYFIFGCKVLRKHFTGITFQHSHGIEARGSILWWILAVLHLVLFS